MDFLNKMGETLTSKSKDVAKKAKDITEIAKLSGQIGIREADLNRIYQELGRLVYAQKSEWFNQQLSEKVGQADEVNQEIERMKKELLALKGLKQCPGCGEEISDEVVFCPKCGARMPEAEQETEAEAADTAEAASEQPHEEQAKSEGANVCPGCGKPVDGDSVYCPNCGAKLKETENQ